MLARRLPFAGATRMDSMVAIFEREPFSLDEPINETLQTIVETCLQKDRGKRYQSIDELLAILKECEMSPLHRHRFLMWFGLIEPEI